MAGATQAILKQSSGTIPKTKAHDNLPSLEDSQTEYDKMIKEKQQQQMYILQQREQEQMRMDIQQAKVEYRPSGSH
jgi:hypothetical protein